VGTALLMVAPATAHSRLWPNSGGWSINQSAEDCSMADTYEGPGATMLVILAQPDGRVVLGVTNYNWSTVEDQRYDLSFRLNGQEFGGGASIGYRDGIRRSFVAGFPGTFLDHIAAGSDLEIYNGETLVDDLSLDGTAEAVATLRRCVAIVRAEQAAAERERRRLEHIPRDPFAVPDRQPATGTNGLNYS
jgi:hypothetical protein